MAVTLETIARNAAVDGICDLVDVSSPGILEFKTAGGTSTKDNGKVAELTFSATAFDAGGTAGAGICTADTITSDTNADGGTTAKAYFYDGAGAPILTCSVGAGSGDIDLSSVIIGAGDTVAVTALTVTVPAS